MSTTLRKLSYGFSMSVFCLALAGCGDGTVEIKSKSAGNPVIIEKPVIVERPVIVEKASPTRETSRTETTTPSGQTTKTEAKTITR